MYNDAQQRDMYKPCCKGIILWVNVIKIVWETILKDLHLVTALTQRHTVLDLFDMDQEYYHGKNDGPVTLLLGLHWDLC